MNLSDEIRKQIEKNKGLKLAVGEINNHLSILEELVRKDIMEQVDEAYQHGYDKGYADKTNNDEVCKKLAKDIQDEGYKRGLEDGKRTAVGAAELREKLEYQKGLDDAWECAKKLFSSMADSDIEKAFPIEWNNGGFNALINLQPQEAIAKLKAYEEKQEADDKIEVGDEVNWIGDCFIVTRIFQPHNMKGQCDGIDDDGCTYHDVLMDDLEKTGRHYDIASILEDMRND